jgi:hypothetical protein
MTTLGLMGIGITGRDEEDFLVEDRGLASAEGDRRSLRSG